MSLRPCGIVILIAAAHVYCLHTRASAAAQKTPSLQEFFERLVQDYDPTSLPKFENLLKVTDQIASARPDDISKALPAIFTALAHQDEPVKAYACSALFEIARRPDGAELLRNRIDAIGHDLLTSPYGHTQGGEVIILGSLMPKPPPQVVSILLNFLKQTDRDLPAQGGSIFELVRIAPEDPEVISAIEEFLSRPLDSNTRIGVLNGLGNPSVKDVRVIAMVIASMDDPDEGVRSTAIRALMRMGTDALKQAESTLRRLAEDPQQPAEVRADAAEALHKIHLPPK